MGPVTGTALGADSGVIALSVAAGLTKSVLVMVGTPFVAKSIGLDNPHSAMIYGGLMGTTSGVAGGLAAIDPAFNLVQLSLTQIFILDESLYQYRTRKQT